MTAKIFLMSLVLIFSEVLEIERKKKPVHFFSYARIRNENIAINMWPR